MVRLAPDAPLQADVNCNILYRDRFWFGAGYRSGAALIGAGGCSVKADCASATRTTWPRPNFATTPEGGRSGDDRPGLRQGTHSDQIPTLFLMTMIRNAKYLLIVLALASGCTTVRIQKADKAYGLMQYPKSEAALRKGVAA